MRRLRPDPYWALALAFALLAAAPLTAPGYFSGAHDARHSVYLLQMFDATFRDGALVPRWGADVTFGYGYPVWIIFAPLPYYLAELFHLAGGDFVSAVKFVYAFALIGSALAMFLFTSHIMGKPAGLVAAVTYTYIPYHLVDLYVRAAWPETLSFLFLPLILFSLYRLCESAQLSYVGLAALSYGGLVLTHVVMTALFSLLIGAYLVFLWTYWGRRPVSNRVRFFGFPILSIALGLGIGAVFLLPSVLEQPYLSQSPFTGGFFDFHNHYISFAQLLSPFWGYGFAGINGGDQFSLQVGLIPLLLGFVAAGAALLDLLRARRASLVTAHVLFFSLVTAAALFGTLPFSASVWDLVSRVGAYVQFPWRLLTVASASLPILAAGAIRLLWSQGRSALLPSVALSVLLYESTAPFAQPQYTLAEFTPFTLMQFELTDHELLGDTVWNVVRPTSSPLVEQYLNGVELKKAIPLDSSATLQPLSHRPNSDTVLVSSGSGARVLFLTHDFPGWYVTLDCGPLPFEALAQWQCNQLPIERYGDQALISVTVPAGTHKLQARMGATLPRVAGGLLTLLTTAAALALVSRSRRK